MEEGASGLIEYTFGMTVSQTFVMFCCERGNDEKEAGDSNPYGGGHDRLCVYADE